MPPGLGIGVVLDLEAAPLSRCSVHVVMDLRGGAVAVVVVVLHLGVGSGHGVVTRPWLAWSFFSFRRFGASARALVSLVGGWDTDSTRIDR